MDEAGKHMSCVSHSARTERADMGMPTASLENLTSASALQREQSQRRSDADAGSLEDSGVGGELDHDMIFTCTVGRKRSQARFYVDDSDSVQSLIRRLIEIVQLEDGRDGRTRGGGAP